MDVIDDTIGRVVYQEGEAPPIMFGGILLAAIAIGGIYMLMRK